MTLSPRELAQLVDHTLLAPTASIADVAELAREAAELGTYSICVSPSMAFWIDASSAACQALLAGGSEMATLYSAA